MKLKIKDKIIIVMIKKLINNNKIMGNIYHILDLIIIKIVIEIATNKSN